MAPQAVEPARARVADGMATAAGALLLLLALAAVVLIGAETLARYVLGGPLLRAELSESIVGYIGLGFAAASLLALPAALTAPFVRRGSPPLRSRSALALVPGCLLAVAIWLAAIAVVMLSVPRVEIGMQLALRGFVSIFTEYTFLILPLTIILSAALAGPRTPESAAAAAAPIVLIATSGILGEISVGGLLLAAALPLLAAAPLLAILYAAAPAFAVTPWLTGIALAIGLMLLTGTGFLTPTEALSLLALFGLPTALIVRALALRQSVGTMMRYAALETVSVAAALAAGTALVSALVLTGIGRDLGAATLSPRLIAAGATAFFVACYAFTPVVVLCVGLPFVLPPLRTAGIDPVLAGAVMALVGLAAAMARAGRSAPAGVGLPVLAAAAGATVFLALAALVAFVPSLALAPVRAILQ